MNVPKEAVDAAAKRIASHYGAGGHNWEWYLAEAQEVLEAAAPYLSAAYADVFDEGLAAGRGNRPTTNPYRSDK